jgi:hypothetical protein
MTVFSRVNFMNSLKGLSVYKILVFTKRSYDKLVNDRGSNYVLDLFMEVCKEKSCHFMGLRSEGEYIYALLGFGYYENRRSAGKEPERSDRACK